MGFWLPPLIEDDDDGLILRELAPVEELLLVVVAVVAEEEEAVLPGRADGNLLGLRDLKVLLLPLVLPLETVLVARLLIFFALGAISLYVVSSSISLLTMLSVGSP